MGILLAMDGVAGVVEDTSANLIGVSEKMTEAGRTSGAACVAATVTNAAATAMMESDVTARAVMCATVYLDLTALSHYPH